VAVAILISLGPSKRPSFVTDAISHFQSCPAHCPTDPFAKAGMLHYGAYPNDTRWLPFPHEPKDALEHPLNSEEVINYTSHADADAYAIASPQFMKMVADRSEEMEWIRGKTILFIGSSHDRNNVNFFCQFVNGTYTSRGGHIGGFCRVPDYNFTVVNWFFYGMVDEEFDWFAPTEKRPITFENRISDMMLPIMENDQLNAPDLIVETSLFWDDNFLAARARHHNQTHATLPLTYSEINWHRSRVHSLIARTRQLYGSNVPIMFRTRHFRIDNQWNRIIRIFQLDESVRAIATELGVKLFMWGDKLEGQTDQFYDGDQHFKMGPVTWLFGDMMLFYLRRATTTGCWKCHQWRD